MKAVVDIVRVASAVVIRGDRILLTQRRPTKDYPLTWECPGGKVEPGETLADGLARELREEIGVSVPAAPLDCLWDGVFESGPRSSSGTSKLHLYMLAVEIGDQTPRALEGQGLGWFSLDEFLFLRLAPGNRAAIAAIAQRMRGRQVSR